MTSRWFIPLGADDPIGPIPAWEIKDNISPCLRLATYKQNPLRLTCNNHCHTIIHVLDDLEGGVDAGGFGKGFHEGIVSLMLHSAKFIQININEWNSQSTAKAWR